MNMETLVPESGVDKAIRLAAEKAESGDTRATLASGVSFLALSFGVSQEAIWGWRRDRHMPPRRAIQTRELFDIPVRELVKPDLQDLIDVAISDHLQQ